MDESVLDAAMQFGAKVKHRPRDLGKYGLGMKAASFSHCRSLTVVSRKDGQLAVRRWTSESIRRGWVLQTPPADVAAALLDGDWEHVSTARSGTVIFLEDLTRYRRPSGTIDDVLDKEIRAIRLHVGLHFHRFIAPERIHVVIDVFNEESNEQGVPVVVAALDPFGYPRSGKVGYPRRFNADIGQVGRLELEGHIWPPRLKIPEYTLGGGKVAQRQGFYFYRNDRLIQAGGWNGWQSDAEPHSSLARVTVDLPPEYDDAFGLNVQKSAIETPPGFFAALDNAKSGNRTFREYLRDAESIYRTAPAVEKSDLPLLPTGGFGHRLKSRLRRVLVRPKEKGQEVAVRWARRSPEVFFELDRDKNEIVLNSLYRQATLYGTRGSGADAPLLKVALFLLVRDDFHARRVSRLDRERLDVWNRLLAEAARAQSRQLEA